MKLFVIVLLKVCFHMNTVFVVANNPRILQSCFESKNECINSSCKQVCRDQFYEGGSCAKRLDLCGKEEKSYACICKTSIDPGTDISRQWPIGGVSWNNDGCPPGLIYSAEGCFKFYHTKYMTWLDARRECEKTGCFMAEPQGAELAKLLRSIAFQDESFYGARNWWIGLTDLNHQISMWMWQRTVNDVTYTNWAPGAPNGSRIDFDCAIMNAGENYEWTEEHCIDGKASVLCQCRDHVELRGGEIGDQNATGNVFATNGPGNFGPVCHNGWDDVDAEVVCRQLGYASGTATINSKYGDVTPPFSIRDVSCEGYEADFKDCSHATGNDPSHWRRCNNANDGAGVVCQN